MVMKRIPARARCCSVLAGYLLIAAGCAPMLGIPWEVSLREAGHDRSDLLQQSRRWVASAGRVDARDRLSKQLPVQDEAGGFLEARIMATNADKSYVFPGSVATIPRAERSRIGIYFVLGFNQHKGRSGPIIHRTVEQMCALGYRARLIDVGSRRTAQEDAVLLANALRQDLPHVDKAVLLGFSRGSTDIVHFWLGPAHQLPASELAKIKIWANFAGVIRGSEVARWGAVGETPLAWVLRFVINLRELNLRMLPIDLASISYDRWAYPRGRFPESVKKNIQVINFVVIPDGPDGWAQFDPEFKILARNAAEEGCKQGRVMGPCDGLVESAASILPPRTGIKQWIVRVKGNHLILGGCYFNGRPVASKYHQGRAARLESGGQMMDDLLRALPKSLLR